MVEWSFRLPGKGILSTPKPPKVEPPPPVPEPVVMPDPDDEGIEREQRRRFARQRQRGRLGTELTGGGSPTTTTLGG